MRDVKALVNGQLKFNICKILAAKFEVVFQHRLESNDSITEIGWERSTFSVTRLWVIL
jgi:hypothetical protein